MAHIQQAIRSKTIRLDAKDKQHWPRFTPEDRLKVYRKCGQPCFAKKINAKADEILADPKKTLQFPVCRVPAPKARKCAVSASGLLAASRRARLTKKHPEIAAQSSQLIAKLGTTAAAREKMEIRRVLVKEEAGKDGKHLITIVYADGFREQRPYTKRHILKKYGSYLSKALHKRLTGAGAHDKKRGLTK